MKKVILLVVMVAFASPAFAEKKIGPQTDLDCPQIQQVLESQKQASVNQNEDEKKDRAKRAE